MPEIVKDRPVFSKGEIIDELRKVCLLDEILAENGALEFEPLFSLLQKIAEDPPFSNIDEMMDFVISRSNVFDVVYGTVKNRSVEFREMFGYLINYIFNQDPKNRSITTVRKALDKFESVRLYDVGRTEEDFLYFLRKHSNFFILQEDFLLFLNPACLKIPSAWQRWALPVYSKRKIRYDKSIVLAGVGQVVSALPNTHYVKVQITKGKWKGLTVYGVTKFIPSVDNVAIEFPVGTEVKLCAYRAYNAAQAWTAFSMTPNVDNAVRDDANAVCNQTNREPFSSQFELSSNVSSPRVVSGTEDFKLQGDINFSEEFFFKNVLDTELKRIQEVDSFIGDREISCRDLFEHIMRGTSFTLFSHLNNFVFSRPHLYERLNGKVKKRPEHYRAVLLRLLRHVGEPRKEKLIIDVLRKEILENKAFDEINSVAKKNKRF